MLQCLKEDKAYLDPLWMNCPNHERHFRHIDIVTRERTLTSKVGRIYKTVYKFCICQIRNREPCEARDVEEITRNL